MTKTRTENIKSSLDEATNESLLFLTRAFRGSIDLADNKNARLLGAATATVGAWSRHEQTQSAREATRFAMAGVLAREEGVKVSDMMRLTMPLHSVTRHLGGGDGE